MQKNKFFLIFLVLFMFPVICLAVDMDSLKVDFLQGNYRRVIFEGERQVDRVNTGQAEELNYILGLSYLKENKLGQAQDCFKRILGNLSGKFKAQADLGLADTYLIGGQFQQAQDIYNKLITDSPNNSQKAALLYRLSQIEFKKGNNLQGNDYLFKLRRDFPLSPELRLNKGLVLIEAGAIAVQDSSEYFVQVGFFTSGGNANNLKDKLLAKGYSAYVEGDGAGYRVKVGRFKARQEALDLEDKLAKEGFQTKIYPQ